MISRQLILVRREIWEHRSLYITPIVIGIVVTLGVLAMLMFVSGYGAELNVAIFGAQNMAEEPERQAILTGFFLGTSWVFVISLAIFTVFYCLDSLYAERKDKSILFWRSLPVTDAETVISKLITAIVVLPLVTVLAIIATHLVNLIVTSIWVASKGGDGGLLIWGSVPLFDNWIAAFVVVMASGIWMAPFIGWFLFVSAFAKRAPWLMAFMPLILIALLEKIILRTSIFAEKVLGRGDGMPIFQGGDFERLFDEERWRLTESASSLLAYIDVMQFITSPAMWAGVLVCGLLSTGAIYVRRFRGES